MSDPIVVLARLMYKLWTRAINFTGEPADSVLRNLNGTLSRVFVELAGDRAAALRHLRQHVDSLAPSPGPPFTTAAFEELLAEMVNFVHAGLGEANARACKLFDEAALDAYHNASAGMPFPPAETAVYSRDDGGEVDFSVFMDDCQLEQAATAAGAAPPPPPPPPSPLPLDCDQALHSRDPPAGPRKRPRQGEFVYVEDPIFDLKNTLYFLLRDRLHIALAGHQTSYPRDIAGIARMMIPSDVVLSRLAVSRLVLEDAEALNDEIRQTFGNYSCFREFGSCPKDGTLKEHYRKLLKDFGVIESEHFPISVQNFHTAISPQPRVAQALDRTESVQSECATDEFESPRPAAVSIEDVVATAGDLSDEELKAIRLRLRKIADARKQSH